MASDMTAEDDTPVLAGEFPPATGEMWRKLVEGVLKGAPFERLVSKTADGIPINPIYPRAVGAHVVAGRAPGAPWQIMQRVDHPDPVEANRQALIDLDGGATGLTLVFAGSVSANGYGLDGSAETLARVLDGVVLNAGIAIDFNLSPATRGVVRHLPALLKARNVAPSAVNLRASINPIGGFAAAGASPTDWNATAKSFAALVGELASAGFRGPLAVADGRLIHNAGGSEAQELAFAIASAVTYLRALEDAGMALDAARKLIYFRLSADADQFLTIAKFRAIRKLWARVESACGLAPQPTHVAAETAWRMMTQRDPDVNMLRTTMAVAAAGVGGADSITALPHTAALGLPDAFARRIARNTQLVLLEESNLAKVSDPAAGSGGIEDLTTKLCEAAWAQFQDIEKAGGIWSALKQGLVQRAIALVRAEREQAVARRKSPLTGTSEFANLNELSPPVLNVPRVAAPKVAAVADTCEALPRIRLAEPFETLRNKSDAILARTGARPKIFLANLGTAAEFADRAMFAKSFFEAGGIEVIDNEGYWEIPTLVYFFKKAGTPLVCLCSSDTVYSTNAADAAKALAEAGASHIYLAGRPGQNEAAWRSAGVNDFVFVGSDALATLQAAYAKLEQS
jgi:methylmalonyl-CoA mutase